MVSLLDFAALREQVAEAAVASVDPYVVEKDISPRQVAAVTEEIVDVSESSDELDSGERDHNASPAKRLRFEITLPSLLRPLRRAIRITAPWGNVIHWDTFSCNWSMRQVANRILFLASSSGSSGYYVGITRCPSWRWHGQRHHTMVGHCETFDEMHVMTLLTPSYAKTCERFVLGLLRSDVRCLNLTDGGELPNVTNECTPIFVYVCLLLAGHPVAKEEVGES